MTIRSILKTMVIAGATSFFTLSSCQKWVDGADQPLGVDESEIFSTEKGFREVLNGVYLQMGAPQLYGKDLTMGVLSLAGRNYDSVSVSKSGSLYYKAATLDLASPEVKTYSTKVWDQYYKAIANINQLLHNIETRKAMFTGNNYNTFKGESLALRAYLHFDLLRLFSETAGTAKGIPYLTQTELSPVTAGTVKEGIDMCIADLNVAAELLNQEVQTNAQLNKWGVKGLLARIYLYHGDKIKAAQLAQEVIDSKYAVLTARSNADLLFTSESLFKLYIYNNNYYSYYKALFGAPVFIGLSVSSQNALYGASSPDYRRNFIDATTGTALGTPLLPKKFTASQANIFPMVRLTEMYYILAECSTDITQGINLLNAVREARNLAPLTATDVPNATALTQAISNEYRKEFIGEGQTFFYFKRRNEPFSKLPFYPKTPAVPGEAYLPVSPQATYVFNRPD